MLVEAFVKKEESTLALPPKKMKLQIDDISVETNGTFLSCGEGVGDVIKYFNSTYNCWNTLNSNDVCLKGEKRMFELNEKQYNYKGVVLISSIFQNLRN